MKVIVLGSAIIAVLLHIVDGVAATNSTSDRKCARVHPNMIINLCNLNETLSCEENLSIALHGCLLGVIIAVPCLLAILVILILLCLYFKYLRAKQKRNHEDFQVLVTNDEERDQSVPLLDPKPKQSGSGASTRNNSMMYSLELSVQSDGYPKPKQTASGASTLSNSMMCSLVQSVQSEDCDENFHRPRSGSSLARNEERKKTVDNERKLIKNLSQEMFEYKSTRETFKQLPELGSRLQKYWNIVETTADGKVIQITVKASKQSLISVEVPSTLDTLRLLFKHIQHPYLLVIYDIVYKDNFVGILQQYAQDGSVRDHLFKTSPDKDWCVKYKSIKGNHFFRKDKIAKCGYQILKAVEVLYDLGFSHVGQIHSGNVFVISGNFVLGGYENSVLGYRTSIYQALNEQGLLDKIDVVMFGHLLYEMCTSQLLMKEMIPKESAYQVIDDPELQEVIRFVFDTARKTESPKELMQQIALHSFFQTSSKPFKSNPIELPAEVERMLSTVFPVGLKLETVVESLDGKYEAEVHLPQLGWRHGKLWAKARHVKLKMEGLLTALVVPQKCPVYVSSSITAIKKLLLLKHDFLFNIRDIDYIVVDGQHIVVIFQDMMENGSLRDIIYQVPPTAVYASKYETIGVKMEVDKVALYGTQLLQAMFCLYHLDNQESPLTLGYVHTGNIFLDGSTCRLGGFENTLLGCQSRLLPIFEKHSTNMDAYMFGHVIFEMSTGRELLTAVPKKEDYRDVPRELHPVLQYIFETDIVNFDEILKLLQVVTTLSSEVDLMDRKVEPLNTEALFVLEKVRKGKSRDQSSRLGKKKHVLQANIRKIENRKAT